MKSLGKRKASKVTFKTHRKHKMLPKEEQKEIPGSVTGLKPEDVIAREQQG